MASAIEHSAANQFFNQARTAIRRDWNGTGCRSQSRSDDDELWGNISWKWSQTECELVSAETVIKRFGHRKGVIEAARLMQGFISPSRNQDDLRVPEIGRTMAISHDGLTYHSSVMGLDIQAASGANQYRDHRHSDCAGNLCVLPQGRKKWLQKQQANKQKEKEI